jgi:hypothetical protein
VRTNSTRTNYTEPYQWFHLQEVFDPELYKEILVNLPEDNEYKQYKLYPKRYIFEIKKGFWADIAKEFVKTHGKNIRVQLCRDKIGYSIGPHTDGSEKSSILYYLAEDDSKPHLGTSIYLPKKKGFTCNGKKHHDFKDFEKVKTIPYLPNTAFGFMRCDWSFHGVEQTDSVRNILQVSIT